MIIIVHCHGGEEGNFPDWATSHKSDPKNFPERVLFYFATHPKSAAARSTDINARNLLLNLADPNQALPTYGHTLAPVTIHQFKPSVWKPYVTVDNVHALKQLSDTLAQMPSWAPWNEQTMRLFPDSGQAQNPLPDYQLQSYSGADWDNTGCQAMTGVYGQVVCVNAIPKNAASLSALVLSKWREYHLNPGTMGTVAVVCLFCRSS